MTTLLNHPDMDAGRAWVAAMRRGDFATAWRLGDPMLAERRSQGPCWHLPRHTQWVWDGRPLAGQRVLVRCYHGLGDTIQFARFLPLLAKMCRELTVWAQSPLLGLLRTLRTPVNVLPLHDGTPEVDYDVDVEIMELPHALRVTLGSLPAEVPYFDVPLAPRDNGHTSVGLVAQAGDWDTRRSVPAELLSTLANVAGIRTYNLQLGTPVPHAEDISTPDILSLAGRLRSLSLVITADTMTAHLAGALGIPTWTLLIADPDWRWMEGRADSPWYPTMRLFRQPSPGDWQSVISQVRASLSD